MCAKYNKATLVLATLCNLFLTDTLVMCFPKIQYPSGQVFAKRLFRLPVWNLPAIKRTLFASAESRAISPEARMTSAEIISYRGYPVEVHTVTTEDGYVLEMHRIPRGKTQSSDPAVNRRVVFLQHGFLNTDCVWVVLPSNQALAFMLADMGYDVWLGNARGNTYSRKHVSLDPKEKSYWDFSFDEMGKYDIPAVIEYILTKTGRSSLSYIGHSMGCAMFFIAMTYRPELNAKIDVMVALAPATAQANTRTILRRGAPFVNQIVAMHNMMGATVYQPVDSIENNFRKRFCGPNQLFQRTLCRNYVFTITSDGYAGLDLNLLPVINGHNPAGSSVRTAAQFAQNFNAGQTFQPYDFGAERNLKRYGQRAPLPYDLSKVTCPVYIFWGPNDKASTPEDVAWLAGKLGNLKASIEVDDPHWNHGAFIYSTDARRLVYNRLVTFLPAPIV